MVRTFVTMATLLHKTAHTAAARNETIPMGFCILDTCGILIMASIPRKRADEKIGTNVLPEAFAFLEKRSNERMKKTLKTMPQIMPTVITHIAVVKMERLMFGSLNPVSPEPVATWPAAIVS